MSKVLDSHTSNLKNIELLIRNGKVKEAKDYLLRITQNRNFSVSEKDLEKIANLCRRAQLATVAINLLSPIMKSFRDGKKQRPTLRLIAEYAMALHRIGNSTEAKLLLEDRAAVAHSYSQFYLGLIFLSEWEYEKAKNCFIEYLKSRQLDSYELSLGELNLLATNIFLDPNNDSHEAEIMTFISRLEKLGFTLLANNAKEVLIQYYASFEENETNWSKKNLQTKERFQQILLNGNKLLTDLHSTRYSLYLQKWLCVNQLKKDPKTALEDFYALKEMARQFSSWEILRDCEFYIAKIKNSQDLFNKLYYGTPYTGYRQYILKRHEGFKPDEFYFWTSNQNLFNKKQVLDLSNFRVNGSTENLGMTGGVSHRTLLSLTSDLYRPLTVGSLFSKIYPNEYYDQASSGLRVRQCIFRLKKDFDANHLKIKINYTKGYTIEPLGLLNLKFSANLNTHFNESISKEEILLLQVSKQFSDNPFTATQLSEFIGKSHSSAVRLLNKLIQLDSLTVIGDGTSRKYLFKNKLAG